MARQRTLHPDFFTDEKVVTVSFAARLMFQGLWCEADREGRLEDKPLRLKMKLFPADDVDGAELIAELIAAGLVARYAVDGRSFLVLPGFQKRQHVHPKEVPSKLPPPPTEAIQPRKPEQSPDEPACMDEKPRLLPQERGLNPSGPSFPSFPSGSSFPSGPPPLAPEKARASVGVLVGEEFRLWFNDLRLAQRRREPEPRAKKFAERWADFGRRPLAVQRRAAAKFLAHPDFEESDWSINVFLSPKVYGSRLEIIDEGPPAEPCVCCGRESQTSAWGRAWCFDCFGLTREPALVVGGYDASCAAVSRWLEARRAAA